MDNEERGLWEYQWSIISIEYLFMEEGMSS